MTSDILPHQQNQRIFDDASSYYQHLRWFKSRLTRFEYTLTRKVLLEELGPTPGARALEVGCGPGTWTREVAPRVGALTALDIAPQMLAQARAYVHTPNVRFVQGDVAQFPLATEGPYDAIFSVRVLEYLEDWKPVVGQLLDAVAPGGRIVIITKTPLSVYRGTGRERALGQLIRRVERRVRGVPAPERHPFWQRYIPPTALAQLYAAHGLEQVRIRPVIYGLPIFVRGTKQYPVVPPFLELPVLAAFALGWQLADALPGPLRPAGLLFSESYAVSGIRP